MAPMARHRQDSLSSDDEEEPPEPPPRAAHERMLAARALEANGADRFDGQAALIGAGGEEVWLDQRMSFGQGSKRTYPREMRVKALTDRAWERCPKPTTVASMLPAETMALNRYRNILPNPQTRVRLPEHLADAPEGYINANYVRGAPLKPDGVPRGRCYIATQGPTAQTTRHFWEMVWNESCDLVVMVTNLQELINGREVSKCHRYWPGVNKTERYGRFEVTSVSSGFRAGVRATKMTVSLLADVVSQPPGGGSGIEYERDLDGGGDSDSDDERNRERDRPRLETRTVRHLWHSEWPDHTKPVARESAAVILKMVTTARAASPNKRAPWIVHCSAGVGRSGTFIAVDYGIDLLTTVAKCDVIKIVHQLRADRCGMVASREQAMFAEQALELYADVYAKHRAITAAADAVAEDAGDAGDAGNKGEADGLLASQCSSTTA